MATLKSSAKQLFRTFGVELHGYIPASSREAQLAAAMRYFGIAHVLDVGANEGQFGLELLGSGFEGQLISFEPLTEAHVKLAKACRAYPNWKAHAPTALGGVPGQIEFHVAANSVSSSALKVLRSSTIAAPESRQTTARTVSVTTIDAIAAEYVLPRRGCMLKADTQGFDWAVLDGAEKTLPGLDLVLLELSLVNLYEGQRLWQDLIARMEGLGFVVWFLQPEFVDPHTGRTLQVNGLFCRTEALDRIAASSGARS